MPNEILERWKVVEGTTFVVLGLLIGLVVWAIGLGRGFAQGFDQGIQTMETGQVQVESTQGGFDQYFKLRSLIEGIPGVEAASARLEFAARVTNNEGKLRTVWVRAFSFVSENKVTQFQSRVLHGVSGPISGLLVPNSWVALSFVFPSEKVSLSLADGTSGPVSVSVDGSLERTSLFLGPDAVFLDLETAQALLGSEARVTSFAVRLVAGVDTDRWIKDHAEAFTGYGVQLKSWKEASMEFRGRLTALAAPLFIFRDAVVQVSFLLLLFLVWRHRESGLWFLPKKPQSVADGLLVLGCFIGALMVTVWLLRLVFPLWEGLFVDSFKASYPFTGSVILSWSFDWWMLGVPVLMLGIGVVVQKRANR